MSKKRYINEEEHYMIKCAYSLIQYCYTHECDTCIFKDNQCAFIKGEPFNWKEPLDKIFHSEDKK